MFFSLIITCLTFVKYSKDNTAILPAVSFNCLCDLKIINNKTRLSLAFISYQAELYAAFPIALLYKNGNNKNRNCIFFYNVSFNITNVRLYIFFYCCHNNLLLLTLLFKYSPAKQNINASRFVTA